MTSTFVVDPLPPPSGTASSARDCDMMMMANGATGEVAGVANPSTTTLYVVQKCWLDGPRYARPVDCARMWTTSDAATQFAHASANRYAAVVQQKKSFHSGRLARQQSSPSAVRALLLDNRQYGFATSGRLFWVRAVHVPLCPCLVGVANASANNSSGGNGNGLAPTTTALVRLHQGVVGGNSASVGGRRGTEDVSNCARLDCPNHCLQNWISTQLQAHQACSWLRVPVGNALSKASNNNSKNAPTSHNDDWWKEQWSDWETWGGSTTTATPLSGGGGAGAETAAVGASTHKRRCSWIFDRDDIMDEEYDDDEPNHPAPLSTVVTATSSESSWHGHATPATTMVSGGGALFSIAPSNIPRERLVTEDPYHPHPQHPHAQNVANRNNNWFASSSVDYAPNKRTAVWAGGEASTAGTSSSSSTTTTTTCMRGDDSFGAR